MKGFWSSLSKKGMMTKYLCAKNINLLFTNISSKEAKRGFLIFKRYSNVLSLKEKIWNSVRPHICLFNESLVDARCKGIDDIKFNSYPVI